MANISLYLSKIKTAIYGKDIRDSIHDAISAMNEESESAIDHAFTSQTSARGYAQSSETYYNMSAEKYQAAAQAASNAADSATAASQYAEAAATTAETVAKQEVAKIVANADSSFDTLKEIADWISSHSSSATDMNAAILALQAKLLLGTYVPDGETDPIQYATVKQYVESYVQEMAADIRGLAVLPENPSIVDTASYPNGTMWLVTE